VTAYRLRPLEVSVVITSDYLLTAHQEAVSLPAALAPDLPAERTKGYIVYSVLDAMVASTFDAVEEVELTLDAFARSASGGRPGTRAMLADSAARLAAMRRSVTAEHAVFERIAVEIGALHGFEASDEPYFDRLDEELEVLLASIDAAANAMGMLIDLQLNERAYVLSVVATIFRSAHLHHGLLRHELRLDGRPDRQPDRLLGARLRRPARDRTPLLAPGRAPLPRR
jgi:Mg2+ and Co2+ transporter CorA